MKRNRRNQTIAGIGFCVGGALLMLSGSVDTAVGLVFGIIGIAMLGSRPNADDTTDTGSELAHKPGDDER